MPRAVSILLSQMQYKNILEKKKNTDVTVCLSQYRHYYKKIIKIKKLITVVKTKTIVTVVKANTKITVVKTLFNLRHPKRQPYH